MVKFRATDVLARPSASTAKGSRGSIGCPLLSYRVHPRTADANPYHLRRGSCGLRLMRVYTSNRAEALAALLCDSLAEVGGDPFAPPVVVVHSRGMQAWLSQRIADRLGICANVEFPFPARYVTELFELILGVEADRLDAWRRARLRWPIFALLPRWLDRPEFEEIRRYLTPGDGDDPAAVPMKRFQLAERIARV